MNLSVVILSFHSHHLVGRIIRNIGKKIPITMIENSRNTSLKKTLENKYKNLNVIIPSKNLGWSAGMNLGIKKSKTHHVFCLTPDITISKKCFKNIKDFVNKFSDFALLAPTYKNEKIYKNYKIDDPKKIINKKLHNKFGLREVDWIDGGGFIYNKKKMKSVGLYDERFFLYFEQEDLIKRIKNIEKKIYVCKNIKFDHAGTKSSHPKHKYKITLMRNWHYSWGKFTYYRKHYGYLSALRKTSPNLLRSIRLIIINFFKNKPKEISIHAAGLKGLLNSYFLRKSSYRALD